MRIERLLTLQHALGQRWDALFAAGEYDESERTLQRIRAVSAAIADTATVVG